MEFDARVQLKRPCVAVFIKIITRYKIRLGVKLLVKPEQPVVGKFVHIIACNRVMCRCAQRGRFVCRRYNDRIIVDSGAGFCIGCVACA